MTLYNLGWTLTSLGRLAEAEPIALEAYERYRSLYGANDLETIDCIDLLLQLYDAMDDSEAIAMWTATRQVAQASTESRRPTIGTAKDMTFPPKDPDRTSHEDEPAGESSDVNPTSNGEAPENP